jgi:hypothetical protein
MRLLWLWGWWIGLDGEGDCLAFGLCFVLNEQGEKSGVTGRDYVKKLGERGTEQTKMKDLI